MMHMVPMKASDKTLSDAELARLAACGDHAAFALLMRRYNRPLYRTARSILKDDAEAEDALQEAYLLAYGAIGKYRGDAKLLTWLTRIVVNQALGRLRKSSRRAEVIQLDASADGECAEAAMNEAECERPDHALMRAQARGLLEQKIDRLPEAFRTVFMLRAVEEMSVEETAACLGIPEATVRTRYFRARSLLREALSREIDFAFEQIFPFEGERCNRIVAGVLERLNG